MLKTVAFGRGPAENFTAGLTATMYFPLNLFHQFLGVATGATNAANRTDEELILQYPAVAASAAILLVLGLICDVYLLYKFAGPSKSPDQPDVQVPRFKIDLKPWGMKELLFTVGALLLLFAAGGLIVDLVLKFKHVDMDVDAALPWLLPLDMVARVAILFGFAVFFHWRKIDWRQAIGLQRNSSLRAIAMGATCFLAVLPPLVATYLASAKLCSLVGIKNEPQDIVDILTSSDSTAVVVLIVIFAIVIAPMVEEFLFRGFAYPALKQRWGPWPALTLVSLVFAAIHPPVPVMGPIFVLAIGLGLAYELTGSLLAPITMHALFNAANISMVLYVRAHS